ncbi:MAG TPA: glycosyltransferase [Acidimicrobiales bacterium]|nr:glycosyltransferase [Acidimicrobiales bacterium]
MSADRPSVDVVILSWNDGELLDVALGSVLESTEIGVNVVVVDNGSDPPVSTGASSRVRVVRNDENTGVAKARNQGARLGGAPVVCFLDSDARFAPGSLARLVEVLIADPSIGLAAPVFEDQPAEASAGKAPSLWRKALRATNLTTSYRPVRKVPGEFWDVDFAIGACQVFRRTAFETIGGLDETFFYGPEDVDFCLRLRKAGWRVVQVARAPVHHPPRRRYRGLLTRRGLHHGVAVARHLWRHRSRAPNRRDR